MRRSVSLISLLLIVIKATLPVVSIAFVDNLRHIAHDGTPPEVIIF